MTKADINRHIYTLTQPFPNAALKRYDNAPRLEADYEAARVYWSLGIGVAAPHFWPFSADAQQGERVRLIGVLLQATKNDLESEARVKAFLHGLEQLGWTEGRNLKLEYRWAGGNSDDIRKHAAELVALAPDILVAAGKQSGLCSRRRVLYRSCLRLNMPSAQGGWSCSEKFRRARRAWRSCEIRRLRPGPASSARDTNRRALVQDGGEPGQRARRLRD